MDIDCLKKIKEPVFFVTNDINRGIGLENILPNFHLICLDDHYLVDYLLKENISVFCLERKLNKQNVLARNSGSILSHPLVLDFIKEKSGGKIANILFFKPQKKIEIIAKENRFRLIGNQVGISDLFEDKISFFKLCQKEGIKIPPAEICELTELDFSLLAGKYQIPLVIQFGRGWAGNSTFFVSSEKELDQLKKSQSFAHKKVKVGSFIEGKTLINNAVVFQNQVLISPAGLQIKSHPALTSFIGGTGGRQWPVLISERQKEEINNISGRVGRLMQRKGFKGFFGLDFLLNEQGDIFLSECNARLTASTSFYTKLEQQKNIFPLLGFHLLSFLEDYVADCFKKPINYNFENPCGSEIIARNTLCAPLIARGQLVPGIYDKSFNYIEDTYFLKGGSNEVFWVSGVKKERKVNPEIEILRICSYRQAADEQGNLTQDNLQIVSWAKEKLKLGK